MSFNKYIPSSITALNLAAGVIAILLNDPLYSPLLIILGSILDVLDGAVARKLKATSPFGAELDSLSDIVTFGIAPAYLYYHHVLITDNIVFNIISICILVIFGGLRLAKFNIDTEQKSNFKGMPIPSVGLFFTFLVYEKHANTFLDYNTNTIIWLALPVIMAFLMVYPTTFLSMKKAKSKKKKSFQVILTVIFSIATILWAITNMPFIPLAFVIYIFISFIFCRKNC